MASFEKISSEQMGNFMDVLGFKELSIKERTGNLRRTVKEKVYEKDFGEGKIRIYSSIAGVESRDVGKDAIRVQYWVDGVKVYGAARVHRVKNWRNNVLNRIYSLEDMVSKGSLRKVPKDSSGSPMVVRKARQGGKKFWGSSDYPRNNETRRFDAAVVMPRKPVTAVEKAMAWNHLIQQADLHQMLMELEHNVRIGLIDEDELMGSLKEKFGAEEPMWCACGCDGKIADHDDRGYGCWPCIECGDDSDTDINEMCSDCELDLHEAEYNTVANSPLGEIVTDDNGRRFVLVDEDFAQIIFEQSPVFRAPSSPVVLDSVEEMLKTTRKRLNAEDRWLECRWCGEKNNELCDCISCLGCYEIALDETTTCPMDDDICSGCCTEPCCYHSEEAYIDLNAEDREESERMTRAEAEALADKMTKLLNPFVDFVEVCGSYRRGREDPGDLDIVIILKENESLPAIVEKLDGQYTAVNWLGEKKTQIVVDGVKVDIKVSSPEGLGAALLYFTGPGGYNIGMRRSAKSKGLKLNEYGIWTRDTNVYLGGATEEEIYAVLDKTYKPPEMRAEDYGVGALWMAEYEQSIDISMDCPKCNETMEIIGEGGSRSSENLMNFEYYCDCDEKPKPNFNTNPTQYDKDWEEAKANPCSKCGMKYDKWKQAYHPITDLPQKNATQYWQMCEICHKGFCGDWGTNMSSIDCQTQDFVCNDCEPFNTYGKYRAEDEEEIDDEDYWEPYLEALEELNGEIGQYVNYASSEYVGIVECISLWQNVAEDSAHTLSYVANKVHKFKMDAFRYIWEQDVNYVWENLSSETRNLLENFNPEDRYYEGDVVFNAGNFGWPNLSQLKDTINPYWLQNMEGQNYSFDLYR